MKIIKRGLVWAFAVFSAMMAFLPESVFANICLITKESVEKSQCFHGLMLMIAILSSEK